MNPSMSPDLTSEMKSHIANPHEPVDVARFDIGDEVPYREPALRLLQRGIIRNEELQETFFHLPVREPELIYTGLRDIALDGKVAALVYDRNRVGR